MNAMDIVRFVARRHLMTVEDLRSQCRKPRYIAPRIEAVRLLKQYGLSNGQIGMLLHRSKWTVRYHLNDDLRARRKTRMPSGHYYRQRRAA